MPIERKLLYSGTHASEDWTFLEDIPDKLADLWAKSVPPSEREGDVFMLPVFRWEHTLLSIDGGLGTCSAYNGALTRCVKLSTRTASI